MLDVGLLLAPSEKEPLEEARRTVGWMAVRQRVALEASRGDVRSVTTVGCEGEGEGESTSGVDGV